MSNVALNQRDDPEQTPLFVDGDRPEGEAYAEKEISLDKGAASGAANGGKTGAKAEGAATDATAEGAEELKRQLEAAKQRTSQLEQAARGAQDRAVFAERRAIQSDYGMVEQAIAAAQQESGQARALWADAMTRGDYAKAAEYQERQADIRNNLFALQQQKSYIEAQARAPASEAQRRDAPAAAQAAAQDSDPVSRISSHLEKGGFPKSARWIRDHSNMVADQRGISRIEGAHGWAVNNLGLVPETDAYFDKLEELLGIKEAKESKESPAAASRGAARAVQAAAPVNSGGASGSASSTRPSITLTPAMREHAHEVLGMTDEEYAQALVEARDAGKVGKGGRP